MNANVMSTRINQFNRNLKRFRLITFDVTDTLLRFKQSPAIQYSKTAMEHGVTNIDQQHVQECFRQEFKAMAKAYPNFGRHTPDMSWQNWWIELVERIFRCQKVEIPSKELRKISQKLLEIYRTSECWLHTPGSVEFLKRMRETGKQRAVISNFDPSLSKVLRAMGIEQEFDYVFTSHEAGIQKPDIRIFQMVEKHFKVSAEEALHIGNIYEIDYIGARNAGWSSLLLMKDTNGSKYCNVDKRHTFNDLIDLLEALETRSIEW